MKSGMTLLEVLVVFVIVCMGYLIFSMVTAEEYIFMAPYESQSLKIQREMLEEIRTYNQQR